MYPLFMTIFSLLTVSAIANVQVYDDGIYTVDKFGRPLGTFNSPDVRKSVREAEEKLKCKADLH